MKKSRIRNLLKTPFKIFTYIFTEKRTVFYIIFAILIVGAFLRTFNLAWGAPYFFHPDERNVASAASRITPESFNPEFFAYGGLPIYAIYFVGVLVNFILVFFREGGDKFVVSFENAILISRVFSALFSVGILLLLYRIRAFFPKPVFYLAFVLSVFSVGYIQYAHFGTFEMWLTFFTFLLFILFLAFYKRRKIRYYFLSSIVFGVLMAVKVSSLFLFPLFPVIVFLYFTKLPFLKRVGMALLLSTATALIGAIIFLVANPYFILDFDSYISSLKYESSVASGTVHVFYTQRFIESLPVVFHFTRVFPFLINPINTVFLAGGIVVAFWHVIKKRDFLLLLNLAFFAVLFITQTFLFVKWNRYMIPLLPFAYIFVGWFFYFLITNIKIFKKESARILFGGALVLVAVIFSISFFVTTYFGDSRVAAYLWARENIPHNAPIGAEIYDLGLIPFERDFTNITLFNQYEFENDPSLTDISQYGYVMLLSQRVVRSRMQLPEHFPVSHEFYNGLISGDSGYNKIYETPCDVFCYIAYLGDPIYYLEESANVFDHPTIMIFER